MASLVGCKQTIPSNDEDHTLETRSANVEVVNVNGQSANKNDNNKIATWEKKISDGYPSGMVAALNGHLQFKDDCIVVVTESGHIEQPVFPSYNVGWNDSTNTLIYDSKVYKSGDSISLTGGGLTSDIAFEKETNVHIPRCLNSSLFVVAG